MLRLFGPTAAGSYVATVRSISIRTSKMVNDYAGDPTSRFWDVGHPAPYLYTTGKLP